MNWTLEDILNFAPDDTTRKNGRATAELNKWSGLGIEGTYIWGMCKGSGSELYKTQIDSSQPAYKCSCPVFNRKPPCKHALGLFLLFVEQKKLFQENSPKPEWVYDWQRLRNERKEKKAAVAVVSSEDSIKKEKTERERLETILGGVDYLEEWLNDLVLQGLGSREAQDRDNWEEIARRMSNAKAKGLRYVLLNAADLLNKGKNWEEKLLSRLGDIYLLIQTIRQYDRLSPAMQTELKSFLGYNIKKDDILRKTPLRDTWLILYKQERKDRDAIEYRKIWIYGIHTQKIVFLLDFKAPDIPYEHTYMVGAKIEMSICFYSEETSFRVVEKERYTNLKTSDEKPLGLDTIQKFADYHAERMAIFPWQYGLPVWEYEFPILLSEIIPIHDDNKLYVLDSDNTKMPISENADIWKIIAISGGATITLFGEWTNECINPFVIWADGRTIFL